MRSLLSCLIALFLAGPALAAAAGPSQLTWEWYKAAETQLRYAPPAPALATKYFRLAANAGNEAARYKLGEHYLNGIGVAADPARACALFRTSAEAGNPYAAVKLGECFQKGTGLPRDPAAAVRWYEFAIARHNPWGRHMLGLMLADGDGVPADAATAERHLEASVRLNDDPWARWRLARLIREREPERAKRLFAEAAAQGNIEAWIELGSFAGTAGLRP